jgi:hypothetical protein
LSNPIGIIAHPLVYITFILSSYKKTSRTGGKKLGIMICVKYKTKIKIYRIGNTVQCLTMVVSVCKNISEHVAIEKKLTLDKAMKFVIECVTDVKDVIS